MKNANNTLTANEIKSMNMNENDVLSFDFIFNTETQQDEHILMVNGKKSVAFSNWKHREQTVAKMKRMGFGFGVAEAPISDDEFEGCVMAASNGENPFKAVIISK